MRTSDQINELATALARAQGEIEGAVKDAQNPFFKSKYADLASVWEACREPLTKHGLSIVQFPKTEYKGEPEPYEIVKPGGEKRYGVRVVCVVAVLTRILHSSGQWLEDEVSTMLPTGDPQAVGSAITYLRRYALQSVAGVAPEDDDAEAAHKTQAPAGQGNKAPGSKAPAGFADWLSKLQIVAGEGSEKLRAAWASSPEALRKYLLADDKDRWEAIKQHAIEVDDAKGPQQ